MTIITDTKARNIKPTDTAIPHGGITGLALHPSNTKGHGKWVLRYVSPVSGKRRNAGLGSYPEISIAEVGKHATVMRIELAEGKDPLEEKAKIEDKPKVPTFKEAAHTLHGDLLPGWKNPKHGQQWINTLQEYVFPKLGSKLLHEIQPGDVAEVLKPIWLTKAETASRVKQRIHAVIGWGWAHGYCQSNPVDVVGHLLAQQPGKAVRTQHHPAMPWRDIPEFVQKHLRPGSRPEVTRTLLEFVILTACRSGEARGMTWNEVDLKSKVWTIPAERMKAKFPHRVPISPRVMAILEEQKGLHETLVFPSVRDRVELSDMAITSLLRRLKAHSDTPGRVATAHGFRSSFRDWCSEKGVARDLAERSLAHTIKDKVEAAYHRTDLLEQRRELMNAWEAFAIGKLPEKAESETPTRR
ncbi:MULTISPECIES: site-specific integrase [Acidovorax]|uniref:Tyrosine-type recombinase/integrase n=2 Tax=Acidovorax TaxID=12916 RepID=A0ABT5S5B3_9BURK|nr:MULTISPECIES: site-specific integrase [Acidovorax]KQB57128.1 integrase [Acidovorax sp. SD340]MBO1009561.1 tyrosine-type recombinase/integrase [Acidovorax sp. SD340]MCO4243315.1 tyrosine-type recombinase/integrase [Acidovorax facilis]MDD2180636.1 tyrosine-type recombinase/integrase [Acidovorax benzenivorans]